MRRPLPSIIRPDLLPLPAIVLLLVGLILPASLRGQYDRPPPPGAWALEGVTVVHGDGSVDEGMTIVVRRGLIETLSAGAPVPPGARLLQLDGRALRVYPGLIDAHGGASTSFPRPRMSGVDTWHPTREGQGLTPHRRAGDFLDEDGDGLVEARRAGVVASVVFPEPGPLTGQPSLVLHRMDARGGRDLVLEPSLGVAASFRVVRGVYPSTLMGVQALIRQAFLDAEHHGLRLAAASGPGGTLPVAPDDDLEVLRSAASGEVPVFFRADGPEAVRRVLALSDEIGFRPVIVGARGAGDMAGELARRQVPVLLTTEVERPEESKPEGALDPSGVRERTRLVSEARTAALMEEAGVAFAFASDGGDPPEFLQGVRVYLDHGLSPEVALRALVRNPVGILGIPELNRIEEGAPANFIVTDRDLLEEDVNILWTFVGGMAEKGADGEAEEDAEEGDPEPSPGSRRVVGGVR